MTKPSPTSTGGCGGGGGGGRPYLFPLVLLLNASHPPALGDGVEESHDVQDGRAVVYRWYLLEDLSLDGIDVANQAKTGVKTTTADVHLARVPTALDIEKCTRGSY